MPAFTHGDAQDLLDRYKRARERRDVELAMSLYGPQPEHRDHPFRDPYVGANAVRAMWNDIAANEAHVEFDAERIWLSGRTVIASFHAAYTDRTNADRIRVRGIVAFELGETGAVERVREWPVSKVVGKDTTGRLDTAD